MPIWEQARNQAHQVSHTADLQRHGGIRVAETGGDHVDKDSREEQRGRLQWRRSCSRAWGNGLVGGVTNLVFWLISLVMSAVTVSG
jgi:hypothetical protein